MQLNLFFFFKSKIIIFYATCIYKIWNYNQSSSESYFYPTVAVVMKTILFCLYTFVSLARYHYTLHFAWDFEYSDWATTTRRPVVFRIFWLSSCCQMVHFFPFLLRIERGQRSSGHRRGRDSNASGSSSEYCCCFSRQFLQWRFYFFFYFFSSLLVSVGRTFMS